MKKFFLFLIVLMAGVSLFAAPVAYNTEITTTETAEAVPQFAGVFADVTDVSPVITLAENLYVLTAPAAVPATDYNYSSLGAVITSAVGVFRQEVLPVLGYTRSGKAENKLV